MDKPVGGQGGVPTRLLQQKPLDETNFVYNGSAFPTSLLLSDGKTVSPHSPSSPVAEAARVADTALGDGALG
jgi:hypothetical protein